MVYLLMSQVHLQYYYSMQARSHMKTSSQAHQLVPHTHTHTLLM